MSDVFISYKRENLAAVNRLVEALRAEGVGVWWDQDIAPSAPWEATIERELAAARLVIVAWSPASVASDNVKAEARWARGQGRLLQVFVELCEPPLFFGERQGVDLKGWSGAATDPAFRTLLQAVRAGPTPTPEKAAGEAPPAPLPLPTKPSIAVLPFANLSGDPDREYFVDGMVEEIVAALTRVRSIFVIASGSGLSFKGKGVTAQEAARELGVRYVLEGSVRTAGGRVRIAVKLMDAIDGAQIWADRFEDSLEDVFALQDRVALGVAGKIEPTVQQAEIRRASARPTENMGAYDLYLRAYPLFLTVNKSKTVEAIDLLNRAIALDPEFGPALGLAVGCHVHAFMFGWSDDPDANRREGIELAHRAIKAAANDAVVLFWCGTAFAYLEQDLDAASGLTDRAIALNPGSSMVWLARGAQRTQIGEPDLAIEALEVSMRLDPTGPFRPLQMAFLGIARFQRGQFADAVTPLRECAQETDHPGAAVLLAATYGHMGRTAEAREALARYRTLTLVPIEVYARAILRHPGHVQLFLDGIALAEGKGPADDTGLSTP